MPGTPPTTREPSGLVRVEYRLSLERALPVRDPLRGRFAFQVMPEPLKDAALVVELILLLGETVRLAGIHQHHDILPRPTRIVIEERSLARIDGAIIRTHLEEHRLH